MAIPGKSLHFPGWEEVMRCDAMECDGMRWNVLGWMGRGRAENGVRTRDLRLGKPTLYQLSYFREFCLPLQGLGLQIYEFKFIYR